MFSGTKVNINGEEYVIPPLSLGQLRNGALGFLQEHDRLIAETKVFEAYEIRSKVILLALQRNYPDFQEDKLVSFLDMANIGSIWLSVLGASGFTPGEEIAAKPVGT